MIVNLVQSTPNAVKLLTDVASICYGKEEASNPDKLFKHLYSSGHHSVFEHIYFTFKIKGITRNCLAQLTRHRHASFSVRSQRYCDEGEQQIDIPTDILVDMEARKPFINSIQIAYEAYNELRELGVKKEDARAVLPGCALTELYMSVNLRSLIEMYNLRTSPQAQEEIKELFTIISNVVIDEYEEFEFIFKGEE